MPSKTAKQHRFMELIAHNPKAAKRLGVPQSVGKDFAEADKGKTFKKGGMPASINKPKTHHTDGGVPNYSLSKHVGLKGGGMAESKKMVGKEVAFMKKKGAPASMVKHETAEMGMMKKGGKVKKMCKGGGIESKGKTKGKVC